MLNMRVSDVFYSIPAAPNAADFAEIVPQGTSGGLQLGLKVNVADLIPLESVQNPGFVDLVVREVSNNVANPAVIVNNAIEMIPGRSYEIEFPVQNIGSGDAIANLPFGAALIEVGNMNAQAIPLVFEAGSQTSPALLSGQTGIFKARFKFESQIASPAATYHLQVKVNCSEFANVSSCGTQMIEKAVGSNTNVLSYDNNMREGSDAVVVRRLNLVVQLSADPDPVWTTESLCWKGAASACPFGVSGHPVSVKFVIAENGSASSQHAPIESVSVSAQAIFPMNSGPMSAPINITGLAVGGIKNGQINVDLLALTGPFNIEITADPQGDVIETSEGDNFIPISANSYTLPTSYNVSKVSPAFVQTIFVADGECSSAHVGSGPNQLQWDPTRTRFVVPADYNSDCFLLDPNPVIQPNQSPEIVKQHFTCSSYTPPNNGKDVVINLRCGIAIPSVNGVYTLEALSADYPVQIIP